MAKRSGWWRKSWIVGWSTGNCVTWSNGRVSVLNTIPGNLGVMTSTDSGFTATTGASQYLIMPKHMSKELAEPMNINWKTSSIHRFENG